MDRFKGFRELGFGGGGGEFLISNLNLAFHSIINVGNKAIYGLYIPKMFRNFNKSHYLYGMHLKTLLFEGVRRFQILSRVHDIKKG
jgi:hypothetical protein